MNEKKKTGVIVIAMILAVLFMAVGSVQAAVLLDDDVEDVGWSEAYWDEDSLWHVQLTDRHSISPTHSWWYGQEATGNYDTGAANFGGLISQPIDLTTPGITDATLTFWTYWSTEDGGFKFDQKHVQVSTDGGATWTTLEQLSGVKQWSGWETTSLADYIGQEIKLRFFFYTFDMFANQYEGWFIDNINVETVGGAAQPDLNITEKYETLLNGDFSVTYNVTNIGAGDAGASHTTIYIDGVNVLEDPVPALVAGASYTNTVGTFPCPCGTTVNVTVCADNLDTIDESDEANNCMINYFDCLPCAAIEVNKTVWNEKTGEWTDEILCAAINDELMFKCEILNNGTGNLTDVRFWDIMTCSMNYTNNTINMTTKYAETNVSDKFYADKPIFKQKFLHSVDYLSGDAQNKKWQELSPNADTNYIFTAWDDTDDSCDLTWCDQVQNDTGEWYHVDWVTYTLNTTNATGTFYFESWEMYNYTDPDFGTGEVIGSKWRMVCDGCPDLDWGEWTVTGWSPGTGILDNGDTICMDSDGDGESDGCFTLQEDVKPDIWISREWEIDVLNGTALTLGPGDSVTMEFNATVVANGEDYNEQYAKAKTEAEGWIYAYPDWVFIYAPEQKIYFVPKDNTAAFGDTVDVDIWVEACEFKSGETVINYGGGDCPYVVSYTPNLVDFLYNEIRNIGDTPLWLTFAAGGDALIGPCWIGTLSLRCDMANTASQQRALTFACNKLFDPYGIPLTGIEWQDGTFTCAAHTLCGDVNADGAVNMGDVGALHNYVNDGTLPVHLSRGDVAECATTGVDMGDVGLLFNHVTFDVLIPHAGPDLYPITCCPDED